MRGGSVMPCSTSVTTITQNVRKTIRFRCGNGLPSAISHGKGEGGGEGDDASHAGPAHDEDFTRRQAVFRFHILRSDV